ncbi:MAG: hypothetical protein A3G75_10655 [Verrucomicrobia bacterium RIFCSPLOWO2_12_FULL_64_8]|nr:MAG: hypothetical protein A3G75_10655 [Verrucomicrobia bacterium RIFCSPLOWO2_12_FULL_64_8]
MSGRANILVVEDVAMVRRLVELALGRAGYEVSGAADGAQALQHATGRRVDAVVLDIDLPDMDGFTVAARLRAMEGRTIPVIFMTTSGAPGVAAKVAAAGDAALLVKPFSLQDLLQTLASGLTHSPPRDAPTANAAD